MKTVTLKCSWCGKSFEKSIGEFNRCRREGQEKFYCSQSHQAQMRNKVSPNRNNSTTHLNPANQLSDLSPFKWFMARTRQRTKAVNVDAAYLKEVWETQQGICPLTGWKLVLPDNTMGWRGGKCPENASMDRVDSSRGYERGNVRFVALIANLAKAEFTDNDVIAFCRAVSTQLENR